MQGVNIVGGGMKVAHFFATSCESTLIAKLEFVKYSIKPLTSPRCPEGHSIVTRPNQQISLVN